MNTTLRLLGKERSHRNGKRNHRNNERPAGPLGGPFCRRDSSQFTGHLFNFLQALVERGLSVKVVGHVRGSCSLNSTRPQLGRQLSKATRFALGNPCLNARVIQQAVASPRFVHVTPFSSTNIGTGERYPPIQASHCGQISLMEQLRAEA